MADQTIVAYHAFLLRVSTTVNKIASQILAEVPNDLVDGLRTPLTPPSDTMNRFWRVNILLENLTAQTTSMALIQQLLELDNERARLKAQIDADRDPSPERDEQLTAASFARVITNADPVAAEADAKLRDLFNIEVTLTSLSKTNLFVIALNDLDRERLQEMKDLEAEVTGDVDVEELEDEPINPDPVFQHRLQYLRDNFPGLFDDPGDEPAEFDLDTEITETIGSLLSVLEWLDPEHPGQSDLEQLTRILNELIDSDVGERTQTLLNIVARFKPITVNVEHPSEFGYVITQGGTDQQFGAEESQQPGLK